MEPLQFEGSPDWNRALKFVRKYLEKRCGEHEIIMVEASNFRERPQEIRVSYSAIRKGKMVQYYFALQPELMSELPERVVAEILDMKLKKMKEIHV